jgi:hypothetical protein
MRPQPAGDEILRPVLRVTIPRPRGWRRLEPPSTWRPTTGRTGGAQEASPWPRSVKHLAAIPFPVPIYEIVCSSLQRSDY